MDFSLNNVSDPVSKSCGKSGRGIEDEGLKTRTALQTSTINESKKNKKTKQENKTKKQNKKTKQTHKQNLQIKGVQWQRAILSAWNSLEVDFVLT